VRLVLARVRIHMSARRAPLARVGGSDLFNPSGSFLLQPTNQQPPARPQDLAIESSFLANFSARILRGAPSGSGHVTDFQVLDSDYVEPACQVRAGFLGPVLPPVRLAGAQPGDGTLHLCPAFRSPCGACQPSLQAPHSFALPRRQAWRVQQFPSRQGCGYRDAAVDTHYLAVSGCRDRVRYGREGDMPAAGPVQRHSVRFHVRRYRTRPAKSHPPDLRYPDLTDVTGHAAHVPLLPAPSDDSESLVSSGFAPRRPTGWVFRVEERGHRLGKVSQRLLLHHLGASGQPGELCPRLGELPTLLQVAGCTLPARMPMLVLLDGQVPDVPGVAAMVSQRRLLGRSGEQPIPRHTNILSTTADIPGEVKRRFLPGLKAGISTSRFR
jgi:hypothetical protein